MGNMSNPLINRWGSNLLWYNFWYADTTYGQQVQQDRVFTQLLETYLTYGLESPYRRFTNEYWYKKKTSVIPTSAYYRHVTIDRPEIKSATRFRLRSSLIDFYRMKVWILRYDKWLIINMYWFHPNKKRVTFKSLQNKIEHDYVTIHPSFKTTAYRRFFTVYKLTNLKKLTQTASSSFYVF